MGDFVENRRYLKKSGWYSLHKAFEAIQVSPLKINVTETENDESWIEETLILNGAPSNVKLISNGNIPMHKLSKLLFGDILEVLTILDHVLVLIVNCNDSKESSDEKLWGTFCIT